MITINKIMAYRQLLPKMEIVGDRLIKRLIDMEK